jgi:hypothetical protein
LSDENKPFDLVSYEAADTGTVEIQTPAGDPLLHLGKPVRIHIWGPGSSESVRVAARVKASDDARTWAALRGKPAKNAVQEAKADEITKLVGITREIENFPIPGGAQALYENDRLGYIKKQVLDFHQDWANFLPQSLQS